MACFCEGDLDRFPCRLSETSSWMKVTRHGIADAMAIVAALGGAANPFSAPDAGERGDGGAFAAMLGACPRWLCLHAPALTAVAALPAVAPPATSGRFRRKWASISPWALDFCAVFGGSCSPLRSPAWGNAGAGWRFGPVRPAKPSRSCKRGSLALKVARLTCV